MSGKFFILRDIYLPLSHVHTWFGSSVGPGFKDQVIGYPIFEVFSPLAQAIGTPDCLDYGRDPTASSILTPLIRGTQQS